MLNLNQLVSLIWICYWNFIFFLKFFIFFLTSNTQLPNKEKCKNDFRVEIKDNLLQRLTVIQSPCHSHEYEDDLSIVDLDSPGFIDETNPVSPCEEPTGPFHCEECLKNFPSPGKLRQHELSHSGDTPFECSVPGWFYCTVDYRGYSQVVLLTFLQKYCFFTEILFFLILYHFIFSV